MNTRVQKWRFKLSEYDYEIVYKPERLNANADALSRNPVKFRQINVITRRQAAVKPGDLKYNDGNLDTDLSLTDAEPCEFGTVAEKKTNRNICNQQITEVNSENEGSISQLKATSETPFNRNITETKELLQFRSDNIVYFITNNGSPCNEGSRAL